MLKITYSYSLETAKVKRCLDFLNNYSEKNESGFWNLPHREDLWNQSALISDHLSGICSDLVVIGIGGSTLGAQVFSEFYGAVLRRLHFLDNVDPVGVERVLARIPNLGTTCWLIVSKSGSSMETLVLADYMQKLYSDRGFEFKKHVFVVSELRSNPLSDWARANAISLAEIPENVGGRFSVFTPSGLIPASFAGLDVFKIRDGAKLALNSKPLVAEMMAHSLGSFERNEWISVLWIYSNVFSCFGGWWRQLWSESLAKKLDLEGKVAPRVSTPLVAVGACDQHSILQQIQEGARDKWVMFLRISEIEKGGPVLANSIVPHLSFWTGKKLGQVLAAEAEATQAGLNQVGVKTLCIQMSDLKEESIGFLLMFWEMVVAGLGGYLNIDPYNQPGVELGKRLAKDILKQGGQ
jgi:glucose-6-phosphate isomerase